MKILFDLDKPSARAKNASLSPCITLVCRCPLNCLSLIVTLPQPFPGVLPSAMSEPLFKPRVAWSPTPSSKRAKVTHLCEGPAAPLPTETCSSLALGDLELDACYLQPDAISMSEDPSAQDCLDAPPAQNSLPEASSTLLLLGGRQHPPARPKLGALPTCTRLRCGCQSSRNPLSINPKAPKQENSRVPKTGLVSRGAG